MWWPRSCALLPATRGRLDANSCNAGMIYIFLKVADIDVFRMEVPRIAGAHPISGVGDGAFWNEAGALSAVKGHDRGCDISIIGAPGELKIHNAALGTKARRDMQQVVRHPLICAATSHRFRCVGGAKPSIHTRIL